MRVLGIGVDLVEVERLRSLLERRPRFREEVFTASELADCADGDEVVGLAARWAAREAAVKALGGVPDVGWRDVVVARGDDGRPRIALAGSARKRAQETGVEDVLVSLSHERSVAAAFCVAVGA